ncbi:hypothetical protein RJ640_001853 [Escallonia rubra]|uniref:S-locus receptor kinase C-terminal domain-containing protein n=1 Tax=Escallonia rubra TaxID=112253 RepID=A0AA88S3F5_9ASTE|nr:hypothetical protein RJ640_001853 [Escallonia rubra]
MAVQNATPKDLLMFAGPAEATAKPAHEPIALTQENHAENMPSFPAGEQSNNKTLPKACNTPVAVLRAAAKSRTFDIMQLPAPEQPVFFTGRTWLKSTPYESKSNEISANNVSITEMEPR